MLLLHHVSDFCHLDSVSKLWLSRVWFFGFRNQNFFECQIRRDWKNRGLLQRTDDSKNLRCETLYIADYEYINITSFAVLDIKLWLEEDSDLDMDRPIYSFKFIKSKTQNWYKMMSSLSHNFISNKANQKIFIYFQSAIMRVSFLKIWKW